MKKVLSIILCIVIIFSVFSIGLTSNAITDNESIENEVMPCFATIDSYIITFDISGLIASVDVRLVSSYYTNLSISAQLQKKTSSGYETVKTWTASATSDISLALSGTKTINPLNEYRLRIEFVADQENIVIFRDPT